VEEAGIAIDIFRDGKDICRRWADDWWSARWWATEVSRRLAPWRSPKPCGDLGQSQAAWRSQ